MPIVQTIYTSAATRPFPEAELRGLLTVARSRNTEVQVSGVLLYQTGTFLQVLEGDEDEVARVYERICRDARHRDVLLLLRRTVTERNFGDWSMGFVDIGGGAAALPGFRPGRSLADLSGDTATIERVVAGFRDGRWQRAMSGPGGL
jgi:hypothetical protein